MSIRFSNPVALLTLLGLVPLLFWSKRLGGLRPFRRYLCIGLRLLIFAMCALALAGLEFTRESDQLTVFFAIDQSHSVGQKITGAVVGYINKACKKMKAKDRAGVVVFAGDASLECTPTTALELDQLLSVVERDQTDIGAGLQLALAAFPRHSKKRVVLISDGIETKGDAESKAEIARSNQVAIDVYPLASTAPNDVLVEKLVLPERLHLDEPFDVRIYVRSLQDCPAKLRLFVNGTLVASDNVALTAGKNAFALPQTLSEPGAYQFEAIIESPNDFRPENNRAYGYAFIQGKPRVLVVDSDPATGKDLVDALESESVFIDLRGPDGIPTAFEDFQVYGAMVLSNVPADRLTMDQMNMIESCVRDFGMGLVMIGGDSSFGAGGYLNTPIERALPVSMDVSNKKVLPRGALVVILHTCEFAGGNAWARDIAIAALNVLSRRDLYGALAYVNGAQWVVPLQEAGDRTRIRSLIRRVNPGDMPGFDATLRMAYDGLVAVDAGLKHVVIISDGDPSQPSPALADLIVSAKITISTAVINPHSPRDVDVMKDLAAWGRGNFYDVQDPRRLPQIFIKEAITVRKSLIFEEPFTPQVQHLSDLLEGIPAPLPQLKGYVCTTGKDSAQVPLVSQHKDPVLAHWRYGLGKAVAFTSDAKNRWAAAWLSWDHYKKFWNQALRWVIRNVDDSDFQVSVSSTDGKGFLGVDALTEDGTPLNFLKMEATVVKPNFERLKVPLEQVSPGRYEANFAAEGVGTYMINLQHKTPKGQSGFQRTGMAISYSDEFKSLQSDQGLLHRLKNITRGRVLDIDTPVFDHDLPGKSAPTPLWPILLLWAVCLFPVDVAIRRVFLDLVEVRQTLHTALEKLHLIRTKSEPTEREATLGRLLNAKTQAIEPRPAAEAEEPAFMQAAEQAAESPKAPTPGQPTEQQPEPDKPEPPKEEDSYTQQLLKAKRRARKALE